MKKRKPSPRKQKQAKEAAAQGEPTRRDTLKLLRTGLVGGVALGGAGWWVVSGVRATAAEQDLSRMGRGMPAIVQIHDPQCSMCTELQREARKALKCFDENEVLYLVASLRTEQGAAFAAQMGLPHVTLVLMDGAGQRVNVLQGVRQRDELKGHFETFVSTA